MGDPEVLLADLWAQDEPPERDPAFVLEAMAHIERRRLWQSIAALAGAAAMISLVLWALAPVIAELARALPLDGSMLGPLIAAGVMAVFLWSWASDRLQPFEA
jgi:hypothetical protein